MKRSLLTLLIVLWISATSFAQLTGVKTVPGDFPTVAAAIAALNTSGVGTGGVTFNVAAGHTETFATSTDGYITTLTGSETNPIKFMKTGTGLNPVITAAAGVSATMDAIIAIAGTDYVTFDGINLMENTANTTVDAMMEFGYAILKASATDGSQNITILNSTVSLNKDHTLSTGIYSNNHTVSSITQLTVTNITGTNSYMKLSGNTIANCYNGIALNGFNSPSPYAFFDQNNEIGVGGANTITNIGGGAEIGNGIYTKYQNNLKVANNMITSTTAGNKNLYGIYLTSANNASYDLYNNTVTIRFTPTDPYGNNGLYPIYCDMGASGTTNISNIYDNKVIDCTFPTSFGSAITYGLFLLNMGVDANVYGNIVSNNKIGSASSTTTGQIRFMWVQSASTTKGTTKVYNNTVSGNSRIQSVRGSGITYYLAIAGTGNVLEAYNNVISDNIVASNGGSYGLYVTYTDVVSKSVYNNTITNLSDANGSVSGIYNSGGKLNKFFNNKVQKITSSADATGASFVGIYHGSSTEVYYYNNMISELSNPGSISTLGYAYNTLSGFYVDNSTGYKGFFNNTVFLNATTTATTFGSSAFASSSLTNTHFRNNIFINTSASAGVNGKTAAVRSRNLTYVNFTSNYNNFYAGVPGASNKIFINGSSEPYQMIQTLAEYKTLMTPNDLQSVTELPPFVNVTTSPYDLHIQTTVATQCEKGGIAITSPIAITTDIDGNTRNSTPDMGADEFAGIANDLTPPAIVYTPFTQTSSFLPRTLSATITDGSGVATSGAGLPVLYWRINSGNWQAVQAVWESGSTYNFTFGATNNYHDLISYYIVAHDLNATPNVGAFPWQGASGFTVNPPACSVSPTTPSSYLVIQDIFGVKTVGVGQDYTTLTAAVNDLNDKFLSAPLTFVLSDNEYPNETFPIKINSNPGNSSVNTLTLKPATDVNPVIIGASTTGIILLNGLDYVTIDGSNNGTTSRNLTIENTAGSYATCAIGITNNNGTDPSKNITLKNNILKGSYSSLVPDMDTYVILFNGNGGTDGGGYNNCLITNNSISKARYGIDVTATANNRNDILTITNNTIGSDVEADYIQRFGIAVRQTNAALIENNVIMGPAVGSIQQAMFGVFYGDNCSNTKITRNKIYNWITSGPGSYGIKCDNSNNTTVTEISNNLIYNIGCFGLNPGTNQSLPYGIFVRQGGNIRIWHNTISLTGPYLNVVDSWGQSSACIGLYHLTVPVGQFDIRNNILRNSMYNPNPMPNPTPEAIGRAYGIMISSAYAAGPGLFTQLNYNDYFIDGFNAQIAQHYEAGVGIITDFSTLAAWQAYTVKEGNSLNENPNFASATDFHSTNYSLNSSGQFVTSKDIDNASRRNPPDMGVYEWSVPITEYNTLAATEITKNSARLNANLNSNGEVVEVYFEYGLTTSYTGYGFPSPAKQRYLTLSPVTAVITGLDPNTTYNYRFIGFPSTSSQAQLMAQNLTFTTLPLAPVAVTTEATPITSSGATLNGTVNPNGGTATVTFEYGPTTSYGSTINATPGTVTGSDVTSVLAEITGLNPYSTYNYRIIATNSGGTTIGANMTFTTAATPAIVNTQSASSISDAAATLNGNVNARFAPTDVSFEWGLTTSYGNTVTATPAQVTGNTPTTVSAPISGLTYGSVYNFRLVANGPGGMVYGENRLFTSGCLTPATPGAIAGMQSVCKNTNNVTYSVALVASATSYVWAVPAGASIVSGDGTNSIVVNYSSTAVSGNVSVAGNNICGSGAASVLAVTVNALPVPVISGPTAICQDISGNVYTTQSNMTNYVWSVSKGTITAGAGTNTITVVWDEAGSQFVYVSYANSNGCTPLAPTAYAVNVLPLPVPTITGDNVSCENATNVAYTTESGMSNYVWAISPSSGTLVQNGTNVATVSWNSTGAKWISVSYTSANGCAAPAPTVYNVTVNALPGNAGTISGLTTVCAGTTAVAYSVAPIANASTYTWTLPAGATIVSGTGTNSISVNYASNAVTGSITVKGQNSCGTGQTATFAVTVNAAPGAAGTISGVATVCQGSTGVTYSIPAIFGATSYNWILPAGVTITSGANTNSIIVSFSLTAVSGNITASGSNSCGAGPSSTKAITVNVKPATPVITISGYTLTSSASIGNQWYRDGAVIAGATAQSYEAPVNGTYTTIVTLSGCSSDVSNSIQVLNVGFEEREAHTVSIYPNPTDRAFWISMSSAVTSTFEMEVLNSFGATVYKSDKFEVSENFKRYFDLQELSAGVYTIVLRSDTQRIVRKIVINK